MVLTIMAHSGSTDNPNDERGNAKDEGDLTAFNGAKFSFHTVSDGVAVIDSSESSA